MNLMYLNSGGCAHPKLTKFGSKPHFSEDFCDYRIRVKPLPCKEYGATKLIAPIEKLTSTDRSRLVEMPHFYLEHFGYA